AAGGDRRRRPRRAGGAGRAPVRAAGQWPRRRHRPGPGGGPPGRARTPRLADLPLAPGAYRLHPAAAAHRTRRRSHPMNADSRRVWVVDDDRSVRFVLATALRDAGYEVDGFENASSALAALRV